MGKWKYVKGLSIYFWLTLTTFHFWLALKKYKNKKHGKLSTFLQDRPLASGHLKKLLSGVRKNRVKYFALDVHKEYEYQKITKSIKSSFIDVYDRFPAQSFELLGWGTQVIKASQSFGLLDGGTQFIKSSVIKK